MMKTTYKQRILTTFLLIFAAFTFLMVVVEQKQEEKYKKEALVSQLDGYAQTVRQYMLDRQLSDTSYYRLNTIANILPDSIRLTVINKDGRVLFDKDVNDVSHMQNHAMRPEVRQAMFQQSGTDIRTSASTKRKYLYYAKMYDNCFVRVALPYNVTTKTLLSADNYYVYVAAFLFVALLILLYIVTNRFGKSISKLRRFSVDIRLGKPLPEHIDFPNDELGDIAHELVRLFKQKNKAQKALEMEKDKLIQHFQQADEGLGIFNENHETIYANTHFMQYVNMLTDTPTLHASDFLKSDAFAPVKHFLEKASHEAPMFTCTINKDGKYYSVKALLLDDGSYEVTLKDVTRAEKNHILKQEMTSNIAHELRIPVTCLRGFLETLHDQQLPDDKKNQYIEKAYLQSMRLSELIEDVSLLSKLEESSSSFRFELLNLAQLVDGVRIDQYDRLQEKGISFSSEISDDLTVWGNRTLLFSVFRNLVDNSIKYAGEHIAIHIEAHVIYPEKVFITYYDTGVGVAEVHLNRLFERFYRVDEGRTRNAGGSGLGLSIVRNAIRLHEGSIQAKTHKGGGLEFLITLPEKPGDQNSVKP